MKKVYLLLCLLIVIAGCEKEEENLIPPSETEIDTSEQLTIKNLKGTEIENNKHILKELNLIKAHNEKLLNKESNDSYSDLIVDITKAKYIEKGEYHSYTFPIKKKQ